jgi:UDP-N-acetylglucosamine acyltransferase
MISGGSLVRKDVPPFTKAGREPLSYAGINSVGLRRRNYTDEQINIIQDAYRFLYLKGLNTNAAIAEIEAQLPNTSERNVIIDFVRNSERGIMKG